MSHFSRLKTEFVDATFSKMALQDLGYTVEEGAVQVRGFGGRQTSADLKIHLKQTGHEIGFKKGALAYEIVADWWGIPGMTPARFAQKLAQRYSYHAARAKLQDQGFCACCGRSR